MFVMAVLGFGRMFGVLFGAVDVDDVLDKRILVKVNRRRLFRGARRWWQHRRPGVDFVTFRHCR